MKNFVLTLLFSVCAITCVNAQDLPDFPKLPLSAEQLNDYTKGDSAENWKKLANEAKTKAFDFALNKAYDSAADWIYTYLAAQYFSEKGAEIPSDLKKAMLENLPAFADMYEMVRPEDYLEGFTETLRTLYKVYPKQTLKYLRAAYAVSLIYDVTPLVGWPDCKMPSNPVPLSQAQEVFGYFMEEPESFAYSFDKLSVGELIWLMGVAGPLSELRELKSPNLSPAVVEKFKQIIKTDNSRIDKKKFLAWDSEREFTVANLKEYGASPAEKMYYTWRVANANGIPCIYFCAELSGSLEVWFAYMSKEGVWKFDVGRTPVAKKLYSRPINPQTWKSLEMWDMAKIVNRRNLSKEFMYSNVFLRCAQTLYEDSSYKKAAFLADLAKKANPYNSDAYLIYIYARARGGAEPAELEGLWKNSYPPFKRFPELYIKMLKVYRNTLIARKRAAEADALFIAEMRSIMRNDSALALEVYGEEIMGIFDRLNNKNDIFPLYIEILRACILNRSNCFNKLTSPIAENFFEMGDKRSALKVLDIFDKLYGGATNYTEDLREKYSSKKKSKELEE